MMFNDALLAMLTDVTLHNVTSRNANVKHRRNKETSGTAFLAAI
jgi:hypothetical protein